jgi:hypothetical protein
MTTLDLTSTRNTLSGQVEVGAEDFYKSGQLEVSQRLGRDGSTDDTTVTRTAICQGLTDRPLEGIPQSPKTLSVGLMKGDCTRQLALEWLSLFTIAEVQAPFLTQAICQRAVVDMAMAFEIPSLGSPLSLPSGTCSRVEERRKRHVELRRWDVRISNRSGLPELTAGGDTLAMDYPVDAETDHRWHPPILLRLKKVDIMEASTPLYLLQRVPLLVRLWAVMVVIIAERTPR